METLVEVNILCISVLMCDHSLHSLYQLLQEVLRYCQQPQQTSHKTTTQAAVCEQAIDQLRVSTEEFNYP